MSVAQELKCACPHCNGRIAYPASAGGSTIQCPHCSRPVLLAAAPETAAPAAPAAPAASSTNLKCACRHCNGRIAFPANAAGSVIACPHCGKETPLIAPGVTAAAPPPPPPPGPAAVRPAAAQPASPVRKTMAAPPAPSEEELQAAPAKKGKGGKKIFMIVGILLVLALVAVGGVMFLKKKGGKGGGSMSLLGPKEDLQVVNYELQKMQDTSLVYVVGKVKNNTDTQQTSVRVNFNLFDSAGKQVGKASDYIMILEPKAEWDFKALVVDQDVAKVEVESVTSTK